MALEGQVRASMDIGYLPARCMSECKVDGKHGVRMCLGSVLNTL